MKIYYTYYKRERIVSVLYLVEAKFCKGRDSEYSRHTVNKGSPHRSTNFQPLLVVAKIDVSRILDISVSRHIHISKK
jgi:hypothetical protein